MTVYAVFRVGVYTQGCGGIFTDAQAAIDAAKFLLGGEPDDRHEYIVMPFQLDERARHSGHHFGGLLEPARIATITANTAHK